jgi:hypothetical protein
MFRPLSVANFRKYRYSQTYRTLGYNCNKLQNSNMHIKKLINTDTSKYLEKWKFFEFFKGLPLDKQEEFLNSRIFGCRNFTIYLIDYNLADRVAQSV